MSSTGRMLSIWGIAAGCLALVGLGHAFYADFRYGELAQLQYSRQRMPLEGGGLVRWAKEDRVVVVETFAKLRLDGARIEDDLTDIIFMMNREAGRLYVKAELVENDCQREAPSCILYTYAFFPQRGGPYYVATAGEPTPLLPKHTKPLFVEFDKHTNAFMLQYGVDVEAQQYAQYEVEMAGREKKFSWVVLGLGVILYVWGVILLVRSRPTTPPPGTAAINPT